MASQPGKQWFQKLKPAFWDHRDVPDFHPGLNFRRKWKLIVLLTSFMALLPLFIMTLVDGRLTRTTIEAEVKRSTLAMLRTICAAVSASPEGKDTVRILPVLKEAVAGVSRGSTGHDLFIVHRNGSLLTESVFFGHPGRPAPMDTSLFTGTTGILDMRPPEGDLVLAGYRTIENTPYILVGCRGKKWITDLWFKPRIRLIGYLLFSIVLILVSIMGMATYLVNRIHRADRRRIEALQHEEHANRLASIGRLASGVAHEINNPLAIINQKTGLIIDLLRLDAAREADPRLITLASDVIDAVKRCGTITRRLLAFARHMEPCIEPVDIREVLDQVIDLLETDAEKLGIRITIDAAVSVPDFKCDRSSLLQIFLNLSENALSAMDAGGTLTIRIKQVQKDRLALSVSDTGKGIPPEDLDKIFEPFYTTRSGRWGAGLGLAITYGLIKEMGGDIRVKSTLGKGSRFILTLPLAPEPESRAMGHGLPFPETTEPGRFSRELTQQRTPHATP